MYHIPVAGRVNTAGVRRAQCVWRLVIAFLAMLALSVPLAAVDVTVCRDPAIPQSVFAVSEIRTALATVGGSVTEAPLSAHNAGGVTGVRVILARTGSAISGWTPLPAPTAEQAYSVRVKNSGSLQDILIVGADAAGTLYGGLDVADAIRMGTLGSLAASDLTPHIAQRGIKFNIPLDLRSPSYSDANDAAQALIPKVWELSFWEEYLDEMVRQRLNTLSLWNLHPFPSMVTVRDYPAIALADVWRTTVPFTSTGGTGTGFYEPGKNGGAGQFDIIKKITPAEKTAFWNQVLDLAEARGISVYLFTWNIHTDATEGNSYGIVDDSASTSTKQGSAPTKAYFRASVRALLTALPKLAGFGVTGGEQMTGSSADKVQWLADTYGAGMHDVRTGYTVTAPGGATTTVPANAARPLRLIVRSHQVNISDMDAIFGPVYYKSFTVDTSYKYSIAHTFSTTKPEFYTGTMDGLADGKRTWLTVRFDDQYNARWGDPDFVRSWVNNIPKTNGNGKPQLNGYYMGPDGFTWGIRSNVKDATLNQLDIKRWWYTQSLFSRLSYNPTLTNQFFDQLVASRLRLTVPKAAALNQGLAFASQITPWLTKYYWGGGNDFENFVEGCTTNNGFLTVTQYMANDPIGGNDGNNQSPLPLGDFCTQERQGKNPINIADKIDALADNALTAIASLTRDPVDSEMNQTIDDIKILVAMGRYYAEKFRGARALKFAEIDSANATESAKHRATAVTHLTNALARWTTYAQLSAERYYPTRHNRIGNFDLTAFTAYVAGDIAIAKQLTSGGPTVSAQPKIDSQSGASAVLSVRGASTSDSEPALKYFWLINGTHPAGVTYSSNGTNAARTVTVTFTHSGRYRFKAIILDSNNRYKDTNEIEVTYIASTTNQAPDAGAGADTSVTLPASVNLVGTATDDGLPSGSTLTTTWSKVSGPGTVTFANANAKTTSAAFSVAGTYTLRLTASDGALSDSDDVSVVVRAAPVNVAPTVDAGPDRSVTLPASASLIGTATDDGLPSGLLTTTWSKVSGPGTVTFTNANTLTTNASFSQDGSYVLRLTANDGALSATNDVTVTVVASGTGTPAPTKPAAPTVQGDGTTTPTVSGVTSAGATVHIFVDGTEVGTVTAGLSGAWTYTISGLPAGAHTITVSAENSGGTSPVSNPITITVAAGGGGTPPASNGSSAGGGTCGMGGLLASVLLGLFALTLAGGKTA
jgi:Bacterial Ig domain